MILVLAIRLVGYRLWCLELVGCLCTLSVHLDLIPLSCVRMYPPFKTGLHCRRVRYTLDVDWYLNTPLPSSSW